MVNTPENIGFRGVDDEQWQPPSTEDWVDATWHQSQRIQKKLIQIVEDCTVAEKPDSLAILFAQDLMERIGLSDEPPYFPGQIDKFKPILLMPRMITDIKNPDHIVQKAERKYLKNSRNLSEAIDKVSDKFRIRLHFNDPRQVMLANSLLETGSNFRKEWEEHGIRFAKNPVTNHFYDPKFYGHVGLDVKFQILVNGRWLPCELQFLHEQMLLTEAMTHTTYENDRDLQHSVALQKIRDPKSGTLEDRLIASESYYESLMTQYVGDIVALNLYRDLMNPKYYNPTQGFLDELRERSSSSEYKCYVKFISKLVEGVMRSELKRAQSLDTKERILMRFNGYRELLNAEQDRLIFLDVKFASGLPTYRLAELGFGKRPEIIVPSTAPPVPPSSLRSNLKPPKLG